MEKNLGLRSKVQEFLADVHQAVTGILGRGELEVIESVLKEARKSSGLVLLAGNGASSSISSTVGFKLAFESRVRAVALSDPNLIVGATRKTTYASWISLAIGNLAAPGDVLFLTSSSGESENIVEALKAGSQVGLPVIGFSGFEETNSLASQATYSLWVDSLSYNVVESAHLAAGLSLAESLKDDVASATDVLSSIAGAIETIASSSSWVDQIMEFGAEALKTTDAGHKLVFIGEGSSISSAAHSATDFTKSGLRSVAITDANLITAMMNDFGRDSWLVKGLERYSDPADLVILLLHDDLTAAERDALRWCQANGREAFVIGGKPIPSTSTDQPLRQISWDSDQLSSNLLIPSLTNLAVADGLLSQSLSEATEGANIGPNRTIKSHCTIGQGEEVGTSFFDGRPLV